MALTKLDDKKTLNITLTRSCVVFGAQHKKGAQLTLGVADTNLLIGTRKAKLTAEIKAEDLAEKGAEKAPKK